MRAFFDIDTQLDFVAPGGALYGAGAEQLIPAIAALNRYAANHSIPLISTTDAHPENAFEFQVWPPHCVSGTFGQQKPAATLLPKQTVIPWSADFDMAGFSAEGADQIILEKNDLDFFTNPHARDLLERLQITDCVVYGIFIDYCVKAAILGLIQSGRQVALVTDASASISAKTGECVIQDFLAAGGRLVTTAEVMI